MFFSSATLYPLGKVEESQLKKLCQVLWDWSCCDQCGKGDSCQITTCLWQKRSPRLKPFFDFYKHSTGWSIPERPAGGHYALRSHDDVFGIIQLLRKKPDVARSVLTSEYFSNFGNLHKPDIVDQQRAFNLAIRIMAMVNCSFKNQPLDGLELGLNSIIWGNDMSLQEFMESMFPVKQFPILNEQVSASDIKRKLNAEQLKRKTTIEFRGTDDLRNHLKLDQETGILHIFHHTTFLKEHLLATRNSDDVPPASKVFQREIITRQLALETLDSLKLLFPISHGSRQILCSLVSKDGFDPDCSEFGHADYRREDERDIHYHYWGERLMDIYDELMDPRPRGIFHWLEMRSKSRHAMMAAIAGVVFAILLGLLSLTVGIFQAWISYQQWKHPLPTAGS